MSDVVIAALYKFVALPDFEERQKPLLDIAHKAQVFGTLLLAKEGINGTICGSRKGIDMVLAHIKTFPHCAALEWKESYADENPFYRMKVRLKKEIVTMGVPNMEPQQSFERYVAPDEWNALISDPETVLIDTRNDYEVSIGTFDGAVNPHIKTFREFPDWFRAYRKEHKMAKVAMFCTGGIRCEKSTAFLREEGIDDVFHLQGGILKYLETIPKGDSMWLGECFVFDHRVSVDHDLAPGSYDMCHACRLPITEDDKKSELYAKGVSCPACHDQHDEKRRLALIERQKQVELAAKRGQVHIGAAQQYKAS